MLEIFLKIFLITVSQSSGQTFQNVVHVWGFLARIIHQ